MEAIAKSSHGEEIAESVELDQLVLKLCYEKAVNGHSSAKSFPLRR